jgi:hypothetical protein
MPFFAEESLKKLADDYQMVDARYKKLLGRSQPPTWSSPTGQSPTWPTRRRA